MKYEELFTPVAGPENPFLTQQQKAPKNMMTGFVEKANISDFMFETQRRTFHSFGKLKYENSRLFNINYECILSYFYMYIFNDNIY